MKIHKRFIFLVALLAVVAISLVVARPASALGSYGGSTVTYDCALGLVDYSITATTNPPDGYWVQALQGATWIDDDFYSNVSNPSGTLNISTAAPGVPIVIQIWDDAPPVGVGIVVLATVTCGAGGQAGHAAPTVEPAASVWLANVCEPHDGFSDAGWMTLDTDKRGRTLYIAAASTGPWMESGQGGAPWVLNRAAIDALASAVGLSDYHDLWLRVGTDGQFAKLGSMIADREAREAQLCGVGS